MTTAEKRGLGSMGRKSEFSVSYKCIWWWARGLLRQGLTGKWGYLALKGEGEWLRQKGHSGGSSVCQTLTQCGLGWGGRCKLAPLEWWVQEADDDFKTSRTSNLQEEDAVPCAGQPPRLPGLSHVWMSEQAPFRPLWSGTWLLVMVPSMGHYF